MSRPKTLPINKCESCGFDFRLSRYARCCDRTFDADGKDTMVKCPWCNKFVVPIPDEPMTLCKHCLRNVNSELRPVEFRKEMPEAKGATGGGTRTSGKRASHSQSSGTPIASRIRPSSSESEQEDNLKDLWRYVGCVCGNQVPDCFELQEAKWPKNSYYCQDCKQPYSSFLWSTELRNDQCPRCNGANIVTDKMFKGDTMIVCIECKCMVSKRRYDAVCQEVLEQEKRSLKLQTCCSHCGSLEVQMGVADCEGNPCVVHMCSSCGSKDVLAAWNRSTDRIGVIDALKPLGNSKESPSIPKGFEELVECCGNLGLLHPVEEDPKDELLTCSRCSRVISLMHCKDKRIPPSVSSLRRALKGTFSSGMMGQPRETVKVTSLTDLKPGDQLDFRKTMYSHHAIVEEPVPDKDELRVIEYAGQSNRPTILAFLRILPSKACVQQTVLKFKEQVKLMYRVDYHSLDCFLPQAVVRRATKRVGEEKYNLIGSNCEHFTNWAKADVNFSRQVEALKESARLALKSSVMQITELIDDLPQNKSTRAAVTILQDIRAEMLRVLDSNSTSIKDFWCPIRLLAKWAIRGIPIAFFSRALAKNTGCKMIWSLDVLFKPLSEKVVDTLTPKTAAIEGDGKEKGDKK